MGNSENVTVAAVAPCARKKQQYAETEEVAEFFAFCHELLQKTGNSILRNS